MPALPRPKHEAFAQALFKGLATGITQAEAWEQAGHKNASLNGAKANASRALHKLGIIERVRELQAIAARRNCVTVDSIVEELEEARTIARDVVQPSAMVSASTSKAKLLGLEIDRTEIGRPGDFSQANDTATLAEQLLKQANPNSVITAEMREQAALELERHGKALQAIAQGLSPSPQAN